MLSGSLLGFLRHNAQVESPIADPAPTSGPTLHLSVHGIVQGVGYRDAMRVMAVRLRLDGWVRNRRDGTVEAVVDGDPQSVEAMLKWCRRGPPTARVERIEARPASGDERGALLPGFRRLPTE
jgi:acylphosphatase